MFHYNALISPPIHHNTNHSPNLAVFMKPNFLWPDGHSKSSVPPQQYVSSRPQSILMNHIPRGAVLRISRRRTKIWQLAEAPTTTEYMSLYPFIPIFWTADQTIYAPSNARRKTTSRGWKAAQITLMKTRREVEIERELSSDSTTQLNSKPPGKREMRLLCPNFLIICDHHIYVYWGCIGWQGPRVPTQTLNLGHGNSGCLFELVWNWEWLTLGERRVWNGRGICGKTAEIEECGNGKYTKSKFSYNFALFCEQNVYSKLSF